MKTEENLALRRKSKILNHKEAAVLCRDWTLKDEKIDVRVYIHPIRVRLAELG